MSAKARIDFVGDAAILRKLEQLGANVHEVVEKAMKDGAEPVKQSMQQYMAAHKLTGQTEKSWDEEAAWSGNVLNFRVGYSIRKGGIAALFLNVGTPTIAPSAFIDRAVETNLDAIKAAQRNALREALEG